MEERGIDAKNDRIVLRRRIKWLAPIVLLIALISCDQDRVYEDYRAVGTDGWHMDSVQTFVVSSEDSVQSYDGFLGLRLNDRYPYQNMYVFIEQIYPNGESRYDTVNYRVAGSRGELLGNGMGAIKEYELPLWLDGTFPGSGTYSISITQAMRDTQLVGVEDVGFRLALHRDK